MNICIIGGSHKNSFALANALHRHSLAKKTDQRYTPTPLDVVGHRRFRLDLQGRGDPGSATMVPYFFDRGTRWLLVLPENPCTEESLFWISQVDATIVLVNAKTGMSLEARSQMVLAKSVGIDRFVVFLYNCDSSTIPDSILPTLSNSPLVFGSSPPQIPVVTRHLKPQQKDDSISNLIGTLNDLSQIEETKSSLPVVFPIHDVFRTKTGCVATGLLEQGTIREGDLLSVTGNGFQTDSVECTGVEFFAGTLDTANPGDKVGILVNLDPADRIEPGMILSTPSYFTLAARFSATVEFLNTDDGGPQHDFQVPSVGDIIVHRARVLASIELVDSDPSTRANNGTEVLITCESKIAVRPGTLIYILSDSNRARAVGKVEEIKA